MSESTLWFEQSREAACSERLIVSEEIHFSEIISAFSVALDITQGHPQGHSMRTALIGMRIADAVHLAAADRFSLFYSLLLKDLGCSSNAAKIAHLFAGDDHTIKRSTRIADTTRIGERLRHCWDNCVPDGTLYQRIKRMASLITMKPSKVRELVEIRCDRGAEIALLLEMPEQTAQAIYHLDEHWNGYGNPQNLKGESIPLLSRICCLAQTVEVFYSSYGFVSALEVARERRGKWFDPDLVDALLSFAKDSEFWEQLREKNLLHVIRRYEPSESVLLADESRLDRVSNAFAMVVDAKSPWTYKHSSRVAEIAVGVAQELGCSPDVQRDLCRAGLLHDIGKLGISNAVLDKPGKPTESEWEQFRKHPLYTQQILAPVSAFARLAHVAGAHHERLDGGGYHRQMDAATIPWLTRILTVADIFEAMTANRPYRDAIDPDHAVDIMTRDVGKGIDPECMDGFLQWRDKSQLMLRVDQQLEQVDDLLNHSR